VIADDQLLAEIRKAARHLEDALIDAELVHRDVVLTYDDTTQTLSITVDGESINWR
jgi:hypothetical protein